MLTKTQQTALKKYLLAAANTWQDDHPGEWFFAADLFRSGNLNWDKPQLRDLRDNRKENENPHAASPALGDLLKQALTENSNEFETRSSSRNGKAPRQYRRRSNVARSGGGKEPTGSEKVTGEWFFAADLFRSMNDHHKENKNLHYAVAGKLGNLLKQALTENSNEFETRSRLHKDRVTTQYRRRSNVAQSGGGKKPTGLGKWKIIRNIIIYASAIIGIIAAYLSLTS